MSLGTQNARPARLVRDQTRHPAVAGVAAALWAQTVGLAVLSVLVLLLWVLAPDSTGGALDAWQGAGLVWLAAHHVPLSISGRPLSLLPLGATLPALVLLRMAGRWAARLLPRITAGETAMVTACGAASYGVAGSILGWLVSGPSAGVVALLAGAITAAVAALGLLWGLAGPARLVAGARARVSEVVWRLGIGALVVVGGLFSAGALLLSATLIVQFHDAVQALRSLQAGLVGDVAITALSAAALPTMAVWGMTLVTGAGVSFGGPGALGAFGGELGALPSLPVLAALPVKLPEWAPALLLVPVALGFVAARIRWGRDLPTWGGAVIGAFGLGCGVAGLIAPLTWLASGSLGGHRMAHVGPQVLLTMGAAAGLAMVGFVLEAAWEEARLAIGSHPLGGDTLDLRDAAIRPDGGAIATGCAVPNAVDGGAPTTTARVGPAATRVYGGYPQLDEPTGWDFVDGRGRAEATGATGTQEP